MINKVIVATYHENGDVRLCVIDPIYPPGWPIDDSDIPIVKTILKANLEDKVGSPLSPVLDFVFVKADGYPYIANRDE